MRNCNPSTEVLGYLSVVPLRGTACQLLLSQPCADTNFIPNHITTATLAQILFSI